MKPTEIYVALLKEYSATELDEIYKEYGEKGLYKLYLGEIGLCYDNGIGKYFYR